MCSPLLESNARPALGEKTELLEVPDGSEYGTDDGSVDNGCNSDDEGDESNEEVLGADAVMLTEGTVEGKVAK